MTMPGVHSQRLTSPPADESLVSKDLQLEKVIEPGITLSRWALRRCWDAREVTIGSWCVIPNPFCAELMATAGFDWICLDMQHGLIEYGQMLGMVQALDARSTPAIVRVPQNDPSLIGRSLDAGAAGVIVPMVNSPAEAEAAVKACRYPPLGYRSWGPARAALGDSTFKPETENRRIICIVMVETLEAASSIDEIAAVPGIDAIFVGPWDLSLSASGGLEAPGKTERDIELIGSVLEGCRRADVRAGIACAGADDVVRWAQAGFTMLAGGSDMALLTSAASEMFAAARAGVALQNAPCESVVT